MRGETRRWTALLVGLVTATVSLLGLAGTASANHSGDREYTTAPFAGSYGAGEATNLAMHPEEMVVHGDLMYFYDDQYSVIRRLDLSTGLSEVVVGDESRDADESCQTTPPPDGSAGEAWACNIEDLAVDPMTGDLYFLDDYTAVVTAVFAEEGVVSASSALQRVAGTSGARLLGSSIADEGRQATDVELYAPSGIAVDREGRLFISEASADRVRMVETDGQIWTVAGMRRVGQSYDLQWGVDPAGCVESGGLRAGTSGRPRFCLPGVVGLDFPQDLALAADGRVLVADAANGRVAALREEPLPAGAPSPAVPGELWTVETVVDDVSIWKLAPTTSGDIFIWDGYGEVLRVTGGETAVAYDTGIADALEVVGIAAHGETLLISGHRTRYNGSYWQEAEHGILSIGADGNGSRLAGNGLWRYGGDGAEAADAQMNYVSDVVYDNYGSFYLVDEENHVLRKVDCNGVIHRDYELGRRLNWNDQPISEAVPITSDAHGNVYVRDYDAAAEQYRLVQLAPDGAATTLTQPWPGAEMATDQPDLYWDGALDWMDVGGMLIDDVGRFWFTTTNQVIRFDPAAETGKQYDIIVGNGSTGFRGDDGPARLAELDGPRGLAMDGEGNLFIADTNNHRIRRWDAHSREITTVVGSDLNELLDRVAQADMSHLNYEQRGEDMFLDEPADIAYDRANDQLWVMDSGKGRVLQAHRNRVTTQAEGEVTYLVTIPNVHISGGGDTLPLERGEYLGAQGITLGDHGSVVFADTERDRTLALTHSDSPVADCKEPPVEVTETALTLSVPAQAQHSDAVEATATLLDSDGAPLAAREVEFSLGEQVVAAQTDAEGVARGLLVLAEAPGTYKVTASFLGEETHSGSIAEAPLEIVKEVSALSYVGDVQATSDQVRLAAQLSDDDGAAVAGREIVFTLAGQTFTATTNEAGLAEAVVQVPKHKKSETVTTTFGGDDAFEGGSTTTTITWDKAKP